MEHIPLYISLTFIACVITVFAFLYYAISQSAQNKTSTLVIISLLGLWILTISILSFQGYFEDFTSRPPRLFLFLFPIVALILILFFIPSGRRMIARMPITSLTYIHIIRVPVEIVLWWLFVIELVPMTMTFEGGNYDIISGITAPFAAIFLLGKTRGKRIGAILWNLLTLTFLIIIVSRGIMGTPYFVDASAGMQPNIAVFYFPFILLPTFIVPAIFFCHLASLYQLFTNIEPE